MHIFVINAIYHVMSLIKLSKTDQITTQNGQGDSELFVCRKGQLSTPSSSHSFSDKNSHLWKKFHWKLMRICIFMFNLYHVSVFITPNPLFNSFHTIHVSHCLLFTPWPFNIHTKVLWKGIYHQAFNFWDTHTFGWVLGTSNLQDIKTNPTHSDRFI